MCRKLITAALVLIALGVGLFLATVFPSCFVVALISLALIAVGVLIFRSGR